MPKESWVDVAHSTNIKSHRYVEKTQTLEIAFHSGATWAYNPITLDEYRSFVNAESLGKHFYAHIKRKEGIKATEKSGK